MAKLRVIYKFVLPTTSTFKLPLTKRATILSLQAQSGKATLWALVPLEDPVAITDESITVHCYNTGDPVPTSSGKFLGTVQLGYYVYHYFIPVTKAK